MAWRMNQPLLKALGKDKVIYGTVTSAIGRRGAGDIVLEKFARRWHCKGTCAFRETEYCIE